MMRFNSDITNDSTSSKIVEQAISLAQDYLARFALSENLLDQIELAFGDRLDPTRLEELRQQWISGNFEALPNIKIPPAAEINGANGAFSAVTNKIYLSQEFIAENAYSTQAISNVLLEEIGHFVDYQINTADSPGDEGAIFAAITQGIRLDRSTLQALKAEDDSATVTLDGQVIQLEQNSLSGIPVTDVPEIFSASGLIAAGLAVSPIVGIPGGIITSTILAIADPTAGWVWVDPNQKYKAVTGVVTESFVTHTDFPTAHDSHDQNTHIKVDPEYDNLLSITNDPGEIEVEWETGIRPSESVGDGANPIFPKWVWPSVGDRVWVEGNWIYDAGHPCPGDDCPSDLPNDGIRRYKSEIHPPRAFATMRDQVVPMPETGSMPVQVTATDLYIHGDGGYATEILNNPDLIADGGHSTRTTPIDLDFDFDILLPPKTSDTAVFTSSIADGLGNTIGIAPILTPDLANNKVHVHVPLAGSGVSPTEVYARHISVGWVEPPTNLHHLRVGLNKMILHEDMDLDPGDGELTFSWLNVDRAGTSAWQRLSSFEIPTDDDAGLFCFDHTNTLSDFDDDGGCGNGELNFNGPRYDFYVANNQPVTIRAHAYDQDGFDDLFGNHSAFAFQIPSYANAFTLGGADNDKYNVLETVLNASGYQAGTFRVSNPDNQYEMVFTIEDVPLTPAEVDQLPIAVINGPYTVAEGSSILLSSIGSSDPDGFISAFQWDLNHDGSRFDVDTTGASPTFLANGFDGPSTRTIALRIIDNLGATTIATTALNITNTAPTAAITGDTFGVPGLSRQWTMSATDPSMADTASGFTFNVAFGDGTTQSIAPGSPLTLNHVYLTEGIKTISVTATDKDDSVSEAVTHAIEIKIAGILPDPTDPTKTVLYVGGTADNDQINVTRQGNNGYNVILNGQFKGIFSPTGRIVIFGLDGNDTITVPNSHLPVEMYGSAGDDTFYSGASDDRLDGGEGNNRLNSGEGNNSVTAGNGNNTVYAGSGNDTVTVGHGDNDIRVGEGENKITAGNGDNLIYGGSGADIVTVGNGKNQIYAAEGNNVITTGNGDNLIYGGAANDRIRTGLGNDTIYAAEGNNYIDTGAGNNTIYSGGRNDLFVLTPGTGTTVITQFNVGKDLLGLTGSLTFAQLSVTQVRNGNEFSTQIGIAGSNDLLATLKWVNASAITNASFTLV